MNLDIAEQFLARFNYALTTIQVFPTLINGKAQWPRKGGKYIATGEQGSTAIAYEGKLNDQPFVNDLKALQKQRMGVYFMVNEGDGQSHGAKIIRNSKAVHTLKALFLDTDEGDKKNINNFCKELKLKPHSIVQSSPGKYHYYFLINDLNANEENVFNWQSCQHRLASLDPAYDDSMADLGQVLRVPGFYHTKKQPFLIKEVYASHHEKYDLSDLFLRIGAEATPPRKGSKFNRPEKKLNLGARHEAASAYLGSLSNHVRDAEALVDAGIGFAQRYFSSPEEWLPNGSRYRELTDQVSFVLQEREREDVSISIGSLQATQENGFKKLEDDFYLKAPGIVGKMVREICHYSAQPYPSFAFAASCSLVGTLKSPFIRGEYRNTPPSTYFLCLASTGRGKDFPREAVSTVFMKLGFRSYLTQKFRSAQGFLKRLGKSNGIHLVLHDEAHHLFAQIRKSDSDYITSLKPHLLSLFSSANTPVYDVGAVVTEKIEIDPIPYPTINYCGFGVPTGFADTFQSGELAEGLLTRFLVLRDHQPVLPINSETKKVPKQFKFEATLREMSAKLRQLIETKLLDENDKDKDLQKREFVKIPIEPDAFDLITQYSKRIADSRNNGASETLDSLQSRLVEQVMRLAVILADTTITKDIAQYCITFVDHCYDNVAIHADSFNKGQGNKDLDALIAFISDRMRVNNGPMQAQEFCHYKIRDRHSLENTLLLGIKLQKITQIDNYRKPGITKGRSSTAYLISETI